MSVHTATKIGRYLYGILFSSEAPSQHPGGDCGAIDGIDGGVVHCISEGELAAVVSDVPDRKIRPERRHLAAHQGVLKRLMEEGTVLPLTFGTIAGLLKRVAGKFEMALRVSWDAPNIFEYIVSIHPELRSVRDRLFRGGRDPSHNEKIELGRLFDRILNEDRVTHARTVAGVLASCCFEIKENPPRQEAEVMNLACLVERHAQDEFEKAVFEAAKLFDNGFSFDYSGPWPPYSFVEVNIEM